MEATVAKIRGFVRREISGERVWRVGVSLTPEAARVTLHTPDKPDALMVVRDKGRESVVADLERKLKDGLGRDVTVDVVQAPTAVARYVRISPRKVRSVVDAIRGKPVQDALAILQFIPNSAAQTLTKVVKSAMANAENNHRMDADTLEVMHVHVDEGPTMKRVSPRAMGRAYRIMKRTSHITVGLAESAKPSKLAKRGKGVARTVAKAPRRTAKPQAAKPQAAKPVRPKKEKAVRAAEAPKAAKPKTPRKRERKGGE
jgi:large subunit ribosomal protein L22